MNDSRTIEQLRGEVRYAERLCQRTARLYRRLQTFLTFMAIVGGGAAVSGALDSAQAWVPIAGAIVLAVFGGIAIAVRPADKAAQNESDMRRYSAMRAAALSMTRDQLATALEQARPADVPEVEPLRDVAWNDVAVEVGRQDAVIQLSWNQRLMAVLA